MEEEEGILHKSCPIGNGGAGPPIIAKHIAGWSSLVARWSHKPEVVGSNPTLSQPITLRGRAEAARQAHNLEVRGSNPFPATNNISGGG